MKKIFSVLMALMVFTSLFTTKASASATAILTPTLGAPVELGQLKVCKAAGAGVREGRLFTINVNNIAYSVPAGPGDGGYCVLAGQFPLNTQVTVQESIPAGYYVSHIEVKPDRSISRDLNLGKAVVEIGSGVTEVILTNRAIGAPTPVITSTPRPSNTPTATPRCAPNCTPTPTSIPKGRLQICKEADGAGVSGYFDFNFANKSKSVPVGACSALLYVDAGTLNITEVARAGYSVTDIYTIPADRLISKNLNGRAVNVTIVQGNAASQTIVVFRNRAGGQIVTPIPTGTLATSTFTPTGTITPPTPTPTGTLSTPTFTPTGTITPPTPTPTGTLSTPTFTPTVTGTPPTSTPTVTGTPPTPTFTPTGTITPPVCTPTRVSANFNQIPVGGSVEGLNAVAPGLDIKARATAIHIIQGAAPAIYGSSAPGQSPINGGMVAGGGFSDQTSQVALQAHQYTFTFAPGLSVNNFSLRMLDYGDFNPTGNTSHLVTMTGYNASNIVVSTHQLSYTTVGNNSSLYGNMLVAGDARGALPGQPGNWTWSVSGSGIVKVVLDFGVGFDPNIGFDTLTFGTECVAACQGPAVNADFSTIPVADPVEGLNAVAPGLDIKARATAIHIIQGAAPAIYGSSAPGQSPINGGMVAGGGFSDQSTQVALQAHQYTFTFAPGLSVNNFSLRMLDYGDFNPTGNTSHLATITGYNASNIVVSTHQLSYTTVGNNSSLYGNMLVAGDARGALPGQPGNWTWSVSGSGIVKVVLDFGVGFDPNIGFDTLTFCP